MTINITPPANPHHLTHPKYRADIDGLRAIAILSVVGFHAFPNHIKGGFLGVDIFFVISGFLISSIIIGNLEHDSFSYKEFYARRIRRIVPALVLILITSLLFGWYVLLPDEFAQLGKHTAAGTAFVSNFVFWNESGYFDKAAEIKTLWHLWSLAIEEQFYIVWPLLLGFVWKRKWSLLAITVAIALVSFAFNIYSIKDNPVEAFYSPFSRFWELMIGGCLAYLTLHKQAFVGRYENIQSITGFILLAAGFYLLNNQLEFPSWWALLPTFGAFFILSAGPNAWLNKIVLSNKVAVWFGLISYPLYLWHWPLLVWPKLLSFTIYLSPKERMPLIIASIGLAYMTYQFIEKPIRDRKTNLASWLLTGLLLIGLTGFAASKTIINSRINNDEVLMMIEATKDWKYPTTNFQPFKSCLDCKFFQIGDSSDATLFVGDSNIEQYAPRVEELITRQKNSNLNSAIFATKGACPFISPDLAKSKYECVSKISDIDKLIQSENVKTVVFAQAWTHLAELATNSELQRSLELHLSKISDKKTVYIILNIPSGQEFAPTQAMDGSRFTNLRKKSHRVMYSDRTTAEKPYATLNELLQNVAKKHNIKIINPFDFFCTDSECPLTDIDGLPLYTNDSHITATHARLNATFIDETLKPAPLRDIS